MKKGTSIMFALVAMSLMLAACTQSAQTTQVPVATGNAITTAGDDAPVKKLVIEAYDFGFKQSDVIINEGDRVRLTFKSTSGRHGLGITGLGIDSGVVEEGGETIIEFVADKAGTYSYRCNVPCGSGHKAMKGNLTIN